MRIKPAAAQVHEIRRTVNPNATLPLAAVLTVPAGSTIVFFSSNPADVANSGALKGMIDAYGDTKSQAKSILHKSK